MKKRFDALALDIKNRSSGKEIIYIPNPGNFGDGLIRYATKKFFSDYNIKHKEVNVGYGMIKSQLLPYFLQMNKFFFVYGGGGGWCESYDCGYRICKAISLFTNNLLVLPSTYDIDLKKIDGVLYARDKFESQARRSGNEFCDDMAFYLTLNGNDKKFKELKSINNHGFLMRTDKESSNSIVLKRGNLDLSTLGDHMSNADEFIDLVASYKSITTDRLHVAIAAIITGRSVTLYQGNYFKILRIYNSSIEGVFSNVNFVK